MDTKGGGPPDEECPAPLNDLQASFCIAFKVMVCLYSRSDSPFSVFFLLLDKFKWPKVSFPRKAKRGSGRSAAYRSPDAGPSGSGRLVIAHGSLARWSHLRVHPPAFFQGVITTAAQLYTYSLLPLVRVFKLVGRARCSQVARSLRNSNPVRALKL